MREDCEATLASTDTIETPRLLLRRFDIIDCADVLDFGSDKEALRHVEWSGVRDLTEAAQAILGYYQQCPGAFAIMLKDSQKCIGCIELRLIKKHEKATFGYILNRQHWNKGYMTETLLAMLTFCFKKLQLNRVEVEHYVGNEASGQVMTKCGLKKEGLAREEVKIKDVFRDVVHYGLTRWEWLGEKKVSQNK